MSFCFFCGKTENDEEKLWHYKRCTWYNERLRLKAFCLFPNHICIYIFNSPFIELKFTKCQSSRLRCPVFVFCFKKVLHFIVAYIYVSTLTLRLSYVFTDYILKACSYEMCAFLNIWEQYAVYTLNAKFNYLIIKGTHVMLSFDVVISSEWRRLSLCLNTVYCAFSICLV